MACVAASQQQHHQQLLFLLVRLQEKTAGCTAQCGERATGAPMTTSPQAFSGRASHPPGSGPVNARGRGLSGVGANGDRASACCMGFSLVRPLCMFSLLSPSCGRLLNFTHVFGGQNHLDLIWDDFCSNERVKVVEMCRLEHEPRARFSEYRRRLFLFSFLMWCAVKTMRSARQLLIINIFLF